MNFSRRRALILAAALVGVGTPSAALADAVPAPPDIAAAPTQIAHTALGPVGYREVGRGPTMLMITGFSAGMDDWAPYFVDALAEHFRVVVFDNAGVGETAALKAPPSAPAMAAQTSALISTLGLGSCDVLGWSMSGVIAQSLAVSDPRQVRGLVLAATQAGTGKAARLTSAAQAVLNSGAGLSLLSPTDQSAAPQRHVAGILSHPGQYTASATVRAEQQKAIDQWFAGDDASGRHPDEIHTPTLVADGTEDALDPASNDHMLGSTHPWRPTRPLSRCRPRLLVPGLPGVCL